MQQYIMTTKEREISVLFKYIQQTLPLHPNTGINKMTIKHKEYPGEGEVETVEGTHSITQGNGPHKRPVPFTFCRSLQEDTQRQGPQVSVSGGGQRAMSKGSLDMPGF